MKGTVDQFDAKKGWGFIKKDGAQPGDKGVFVHHSSIQMEGYRKLEPGDRVEFEIEQGQKGPQAIDVVKIS